MSKKKFNYIYQLFPEAKGLFTFVLSTLLFLSLISFKDGLPEKNWLGLIGYCISYAWIYIFGLSSYFFVGFGFWLGFSFLFNRPMIHLSFKVTNFLIFSISACFIFNVFSENNFFQ